MNFSFLDIGEGLHEAEIVTWLVAVGDDVKENENMLEVQTDKAVVEISAPVSGKIESLGGREGDKIKVGGILVKFVDTLVEKESEAKECLHQKKKLWKKFLIYLLLNHQLTV